MSVHYSLQALPWDIAIFLLIAGGCLICYIALTGILPHGPALPFVTVLPKRMRRIIAGCGIAFSCVVFYGSFIEPQIITVTEANVDLPAEEELTIVALSDFHVGPYKGKNFVSRVVKKVQAIDPDLILLVGDYVYRDSDPLDSLTPLAELTPRYGMYAVLGNHEYGCYRGSVFSSENVSTFDQSQRVQRALERMNVVVLRNAWREVPIDSGLLYIGGLDDLCSGHDNLPQALPQNERSAPVILLSHDPSVILDNNATYPHLIASGHTHGGQIRLPFIGPLATLPTQLGQSYDQGLFPIDKNTTLAITRGVGESGARARLFAPPEILVLRTKNE